VTLVDTNVISEPIRPRPNPAVVAWLSTVDEIAISVISLEEISLGLARKRSARIERWFDELFSTCRILEVTAPIARHAGVLRGQLGARGQARTQADMLLAATAAIHGLTLATRNVRDFDGCGVVVVDPFD
jgi:predicted nucleic acid-binding protein